MSLLTDGGSAKYKGVEFEYRKATIKGVTRTWAEWCDVYGMKREMVYQRMHCLGYTFEKAVTKPPKKSPGWWSTAKVTARGETHTPNEWLEINGITRQAAIQRKSKRGMTMEEAVSTPQRKLLCDMVTATINGETRTMREWCEHYGVSHKAAANHYRKYGDAVYAVLPYKEKVEYRRRHVLARKRQTGEDKYFEVQMATRPTPEVVEMCTHCPHEDCVSTITRCLELKRKKEGKRAEQ